MIQRLPLTPARLLPHVDSLPRIGAVQYLNTRPLVHGLASSGVALSYDLPSRLADQLATGKLDVALIPSIELFRCDQYRVVSDACIGCRGPVMSVKLFFRTAPERVQSLAVDEGSRTSATLARILLAERFGVLPAIAVLPIGAALTDTPADAVLLIGDRALAMPPGATSFQVIWDLGDEWCRWTGLPFVFAVWAAHKNLDTRSVEPLLTRARDAGPGNARRSRSSTPFPPNCRSPRWASTSQRLFPLPVSLDERRHDATTSGRHRGRCTALQC
jgi:chorismate dehydratase